MREPKRGTRTESLSLRIDPKTKFILEFMVRVTGFRITDLIERAIKDYADKTTVGDDFESRKNWLYYWHPDEGVRTINLLLDKDIYNNFEEDEIADFIWQHEEFFIAKSSSGPKPFTVFVQVLWPNISEYINHWREHKSIDRWATGKLMLQAIRSANMKGPEWPRKTTKPTPPPPEDDLDDDIPF